MTSHPITDSAAGTIEREVRRIRELSASRQYSEALILAEELVATAPHQRDALYLVAVNQRCLSRTTEALRTLEALEQLHPQFALLHQERGYCFLALRQAANAIQAFARALSLNPTLLTSWNVLERLYPLLGDARDVQTHLARRDYLRVLIDRQLYEQARAKLTVLLSIEPHDHAWLHLFAAASAGVGDHESAIAGYRQLTAALPQSPELYVPLGHSLQATGRQAEAIEAYRAATAGAACGDAYWSLANLKTYRFLDGEIASMRAEESSPDTSTVDRYHLCFALGKALEDRGEYAASWRYYERGNELKRTERPYDGPLLEANTRQIIEAYSMQLFADRRGAGAPDPDPIFIVGLPRSGSTLIEQILASHSQVDGTRELPDIPRIVAELQTRHYPDSVRELTPEALRHLGERYLEGASAHRRGRARFIDKMPNNFRHLGLIHLMLPQATLIDVRRDPMACGFSNLKQLFASGQEFTYSAEDFAHYYRNYVDLMQHWDTVLPGRILRVQYEDVISDLEGNVRRILEFCALRFEPACLEFHRTARDINTASSEQVRKPIYRESLEQWRHYEPWLAPLAAALRAHGLLAKSVPA